MNSDFAAYDSSFLVSSDCTIKEAADFLLKHHLEGTYVVDNTEEVVGVITKTHLLDILIKGKPLRTRIDEIMSTDKEMIACIHTLFENMNQNNPDLLSGNINDKAGHNLVCSFHQILQAKKDEWTAYLDAITNPVIAVDNQSQITFFNQAAEEVTGVNRQAALGQSIHAVLPNRNMNCLIDSDSQPISHRFEHQSRLFLSKQSPIIKNQDITGAVILLQDISRLENIAQELSNVKSLNRQLDFIFNSSFDGLYITDGQGNTLRLNRAFERITGVIADECIGRNMADLVKEGLFSRSGTLLALEKGHNVTIPLISKTGKTALVTSTPISDDQGNIILVVTNVRDMTELVELERRLEQVEGLRRREMDAIFDSSYDGLYITDGKGNTLRLNRAFERITGVTHQECVGHNMADLIKEGVFSNSGTLLALEKGESVTIPLQSKTGKSALITSTPIFDEDGKIVLVVTNVRDFTELVELERKLQQVEGLRQRELDAIFDSSYDGLYLTDGEGNTIALNKAFERITGVTSSECVGRNMADLVKEGVYSDSGTLLALEKRRNVTIPLQSKTGKTALVTSTPILDDHGNIILVVTNVRDMTELFELERRLEQVEGLRRMELDAIFDSSYDGLYITDGDGNTLRLNAAFERITGVTARECVGRNMADLVKEGYFSRSGTLLALEKQDTVTIPLQSRSGKNALVTSTPVFNDMGEVALIVTNVRDLTDLNNLQEKVEQLQGLSRIYQNELHTLKLRSSKEYVFHSPKMQKLMKLLIHVAGVDSTVLIRGESGVGKEVVADILHKFSPRKNNPFIKINCGAIPYNLLESELFGYEPGAFSGASKTGKAGLLELANSGTAFLDEIAELPLELQVKLLRVLQEKTIMRIGGTREINIDVRFLAGTNRDLAEMIANKQFREDLFYRLNVVPIKVPPLRERREDIPVLCRHFIELCNRKYGLQKQLSADLVKYLINYNWPGNVRELENLIERLVVTTIHEVISLDDLSSWSVPTEQSLDSNLELPHLQSALEKTERTLLEAAFARCSTTYEMARALGVSQPTIVRKAAKYGLRRQA